MGINYQLIGMALGLMLGLWAVIVVETAEGRILIAVTMAALFLVPSVWRRPAAHLVFCLGWIILGAGCFLFLR
jgi:hypothetical protein